MKLSTYLSDNSITLLDFSVLVDCSVSMLYHINSGARRPSPDLAFKIEQATGGQVTRDELLFPELYQEQAAEHQDQNAA